MKKYGIHRFVVEILNICGSWEDLQEAEIAAIKLYDTKVNGYNLTDGGEGCLGRECPAKTSKKMSETQLNKTPEEKLARNKKTSDTKNNKSPEEKLATSKKRSDAHKKLSKDQILEIRQLLLDGIFQRIIAKQFGVNRTTIESIKLNRYYADVQLPEPFITNSSQNS